MYEVKYDEMEGEIKQMKSESLKIHMSDEMKQELEKISEETGLGMSSIARRGIHNQIQELEG